MMLECDVLLFPTLFDSYVLAVTNGYSYCSVSRIYLLSRG